eukprot:scaffold75255_cov60-Phaeocystis_antarctica.AAC.1
MLTAPVLVSPQPAALASWGGLSRPLYPRSGLQSTRRLGGAAALARLASWGRLTRLPGCRLRYAHGTQRSAAQGPMGGCGAALMCGLGHGIGLVKPGRASVAVRPGLSRRFLGAHHAQARAACGRDAPHLSGRAVRLAPSRHRPAG